MSEANDNIHTLLAMLPMFENVWVDHNFPGVTKNYTADNAANTIYLYVYKAKDREKGSMAKRSCCIHCMKYIFGTDITDQQVTDAISFISRKNEEYGNARV